MSIIPSFTLKSLKAAPARTAVTIAGVALSAALLVAVMTTLTSSFECLKQGEIKSNGSWLTSVTLPADETSREAIDKASKSSDIEGLATVDQLGNITLDERYSDDYGALLPLRAVSTNANAICGVKPEIGEMPKSANEILLPISWQRAQAAEVGKPIELAPGATYTVSGFYVAENSLMLISFPEYGVLPAAITIASTSADAPFNKPTSINAYLSFKDNTDVEDATRTTEALFPSEKITYHSRLILFSGQTPPNTSAYDNGLRTINTIVAILAVIIMVACVSLIYNAFAISVNERMRQFGLLASIGASKRQLRNSVLLESLLMSVVGCVLGIGIGLAASAITFFILGDSIASMLTGSDQLDFVLVVSWQAIAIAVGLTVITVLISAAIPSLRAGRVSPVSALRQANAIKISRRAMRKAAKMRNPNAAQYVPWRNFGISGMLFGMSGKISALTHKRNASKGRAASISLAVALVLLLTASALTQQMNTVMDAAGVNRSYDIAWNVGIEQEESSSGGGSDSGSGSRPENKYIEACEYLHKQAQTVANVTSDNYSITASLGALIPETIAGEGISEEPEVIKNKQGEIETYLSISFIPDEAFVQVAKEAGVSLDSSQLNNAALGIKDGFMRTESGTRRVVYYKSTGALHFENASNSAIDIVGLIDAPPGIPYNDSARIVMPISALENGFSAEGSYLFTQEFSMENKNASLDETDEAVESIHAINLKPVENMGITIIDSSVSNFKGQAVVIKRLVTVMTTFCFLFALIVSLIALANVFNTITNGLILRRREFAVMSSIGMARGQFRKMIAAETCGYALHGAVPGLALGCLAAYGLWDALGIVVEGVEFSLPWEGVGMSIGLVVVVVAISLAYGLHRALAGNTVEALRME